MMLHFKHTHDDTEPWKSVSLCKKGRQGNIGAVELAVKNKGPRPIPTNKAADVKSLLPYIPAVYHEFYNSLIVDKKASTGEVESLDSEFDV